ncbi:membrane protein YqaA, SNARE-associated domain [Thalassococcus halodurans]|uniref:Membrane protein YqaA, SNARE-associated domain n=1 Tax=Thalassococcus halodurans TaxID=373675 RepID=A0A1H5VUZ8_9RHOB|nr:YqaA family protein [Thalassococcus halodurans]SEF91102.1 membrane protein YqaA, SNARE-associated domain [Thalassococcus halodurans]
MLRRLYNRMLAAAEHPSALWILAIVSFAESSVFPIPPDVMMIPMILAAPHRAWLIAGVCTAASVAGALLGYGIGHFFFEQVGQPVLEAMGKAEKMDAFNTTFSEWGVWAVLIAGMTPFPFKVITIMSGWASFPLIPFLLSSIVARSLRFFIVAALLKAYGPPIREFVEKRLGLVFAAFLIVLIGGFMVLRVL